MSPPTAHEPFLRAICEAPDDDAPRLIFADYLDETGETERAEFIRLQVQLHHAPDSSPAARRCEELFRDRWIYWLAELPGTTALWAEFLITRLPGRVSRSLEDSADDLGTWIECTAALKDWERGFPATVYLQGSSDVFLASADRIHDFIPVQCLHLLNLDGPSDVIRTLAGLPLLRKLREIKVPGIALSDDAVVALAESPFAAGLRRLSLFADRMSDRAGRAFADSPYLGDVEMLQLVHAEFSEAVRSRLIGRFGFRVHC
jgi:uncharacterized protein (TIGR02996 family)